MKLLILNLGCTKDGVGEKKRGNLRHWAAVRGGGLFHQPENNDIKDQSYNVVHHYFL